jgi:Caspase domain
MKKVALILAFLLGYAATARSEDYVYVLPDGRVRWTPNVRARKVRLADLPEAQQQQLLEQRRKMPTVGDRIREFADKFQPALAATPATRVRVLLTCDTDAGGEIATGVAVDLRMMEAFLGDAFRGRPGVCEVAKLTGAGLTAENILAHYRNLPSSPTETLVFFYAGHGGFYAGHGDMGPGKHLLALSHGPSLNRAYLVAEMRMRPHQCLILLTDCCSNTTDIDKAQIQQHRNQIVPLLGDDLPLDIPAGFDPRTVEWLLLRHTGTIDLTAATPSRDQFSWTTDRTGGFFTYALVRVLRTDVNLINKGRRGRIEDQATWLMAFERVRSGAAMMSLGRRNAPPVEILKKTPARDRDRIWQWAHAFSFH